MLERVGVLTKPDDGEQPADRIVRVLLDLSGADKAVPLV